MGAVREDDGKVMRRDQGRQKEKTRGAHHFSTPAHAYVLAPINPRTISRRCNCPPAPYGNPIIPINPRPFRSPLHFHHSARSADPSRRLLRAPVARRRRPRRPQQPPRAATQPVPLPALCCRGRPRCESPPSAGSGQYASGAFSAECHQSHQLCAQLTQTYFHARQEKLLPPSGQGRRDKV